ncbi:hypothetical protein M434DRAFT_394247 [Hypoxylon sp. CO27-5]|nr:hypothetical protein M434DRAFT_394247 [Hypoxylon sp. CO27-5]
MSRFFSSSARALVKFLGYNVDKLRKPYSSAVKKFTAPGGSAEQKLGKLESVYIKSRNNNPVHQSSYNKKDKAWVISAKIVGSKDTKTCHIYEDGTGTIKVGDERR